MKISFILMLSLATSSTVKQAVCVAYKCSRAGSMKFSSLAYAGQLVILSILNSSVHRCKGQLCNFPTQCDIDNVNWIILNVKHCYTWPAIAILLLFSIYLQDIHVTMLQISVEHYLKSPAQVFLTQALFTIMTHTYLHEWYDLRNTKIWASLTFKGISQIYSWSCT